MLNLYFLAATFIVLSGITEAIYPHRNIHDIYYPIRKDAGSRIRPFIHDIMVMGHQKPESFSANMLNDDDNSNLFHLLPNYNKINKRSYEEGNMGKRVYLARVGKRQYYAARIG